jgi:hypothetical protein
MADGKLPLIVINGFDGAKSFPLSRWSRTYTCVVSKNKTSGLHCDFADFVLPENNQHPGPSGILLSRRQELKSLLL